MLLPVSPTDAPYRILILTSDDHLGRNLYAAAEKAGFEVRRVTEAIMGLAIWEGFNPHLVLVDARPGFFEGFTVCRQARAHEYFAPMILLGTQDETDELTALKAGADDFVSRPEKTPVVMGRVVAQLRRAFMYNIVPQTDATTSEDDPDMQPFWEEDEEEAVEPQLDTSEEENEEEEDPFALPEDEGTWDDFFDPGDAPVKEDVLPSGWTECELCGYRAPRQQFEKEDILGRIKLVCPNCKESDHVVYSLN